MKRKKLLNKRKMRRASSALKYRYPWLRSINDHPILFITALCTILVINIFAILWAFNLPQAYFRKTPYTGMPDNLLASAIEVLIIVIFGGLLILARTFFASDVKRLDPGKCGEHKHIPDSLIVPISNPRQVTVNIHFDHHMHYSLHPLIKDLLRWAEIDKEKYFVIEAGAVDIPKLALREINFGETGIDLELGSASYYDMVLTHHSPDLVVSRLPVGSKSKPITLRSLFGDPLFMYYTESINQILEKRSTFLKCHELLPNTFGISGIVILGTKEADYVLLRKRGSDEIAAQGHWEWSFAGTLEASDWICRPIIPFNEFVSIEFVDEVFCSFPELKEYRADPPYPIGLVFNRFYLFQPEIFVVVHYNNVDNSLIEQIKNKKIKSGTTFHLVKVTELEQTFESYYDKNPNKNRLKVLCMPGLKLLRYAGTLRDF